MLRIKHVGTVVVAHGKRSALKERATSKLGHCLSHSSTFAPSSSFRHPVRLFHNTQRTSVFLDSRRAGRWMSVKTLAFRVEKTKGSDWVTRRLIFGMVAGITIGLIAWQSDGVVAEASTFVGPVREGEGEIRSPFDKQYPDAYKQLKALFGDRLTMNPDELHGHGRPLTGYSPRGNPQVVIYPESTEEVSALARICNKYHIPIVPYGAGTGLEGHTIASRGGVCIDFSQMDKLIALHADDMDCVVQPGIGWMTLNDDCRSAGLFIGVDPAPTASIGGMCGTNCSGTNAVRYGTMKDQVLSLVVVLADGTIVRTGQRARKSSAGYDLTRLFIGSEGTLGIITEITLRLRQIPETHRVGIVTFDSVEAAAKAVVSTMKTGVQLGCIELLDANQVRACNKHSGSNFIEAPCIFFKFAGFKDHIEHDIQLVREITKQFTSHPFVWSKDDQESHQMWEVRKHAGWAAAQYIPSHEMVATDVCVPLSRFAQCITETQQEVESCGLFGPIVGHAGDGNFHVCLSINPEDPKHLEDAERVHESMVLRAIEMEGTCTGEHGVGIGKKHFLEKEKGPGAVGLMRLLKRSLDPNNILNPGKIVDP